MYLIEVKKINGVCGWRQLFLEDMMDKKTDSDENFNILPVYRSKEQAMKAYNKISKFYDYTEGIFEKKYVNMALKQLEIKEGENVLEIGFGTGNALIKIAELVGGSGDVYGIDISPKMLEITDKKVKSKALSDRVTLVCGDATTLPYHDKKFDAVFMSFTLELFDTPEIPKILSEIKRVLKPDGRLGVVSMSKENGNSVFLKIYEWAHIRFPNYIDCRPIFAAASIKDAGFEIKRKIRIKTIVLPSEIVIGIKK